MIRPHPKTRTFCPAHFALGPWSRAGVLVAGCLPPQPPPFERHPHPAGDEGNVTAEVAPSGLGQCHVVEPESARARPGSHDTHGQGLLERDQVWRLPYDTHGQGLLDRAQVWRLPLHYRYIMLPRCLPAHAPLSTTPLSTPPCPDTIPPPRTAVYHPTLRCLPPHTPLPTTQ